MKVFFVDAYDPLSNSLYNELQTMASKKNDCEILFIGPVEENEFYKDIKNKKLVHKIWNFNHYVRSIFKAVKTMKPDIIHFQFELRRFGLFKIGIKLPFLILLCNFMGTKVFVTLHDVYVAKEGTRWSLFAHQKVPLPRFILKIIIKLFMKTLALFCHKVVIYTKIGQKALIEYYKFPKDKIIDSNLAFTGNPNVNNLEKKNKLESEFQGKKIILHFGSISPRKGYETAIKAMKIVAQKEPNSLLVIAGLTNPYQKLYEKSLRQLPKKMDIENNVCFAGFRDDEEIAILFNMAEIALYLYKPGSYGSMAIHHSVQHHTPTIATNTEIFNEILGDDNAIYINPENEKQLAAAMLKIITNQNFKNNLIEGMKAISGKFTWAKTAAKYIEEYEKLLPNESK